MAKILGSDPKYVFHRKFVNYDSKDVHGWGRRGVTMYCCIDIAATGVNIKRLRQEHGLTVRDIQEAMSFDVPSAVYKWERGRLLLSLEHLMALSKLFDARIEDILIWSRPPPGERLKERPGGAAMENIMEELYFTNLAPQGVSPEKREVTRRTGEQVQKQEEELLGMLSGEAKERFARYVDIRDEQLGECSTDRFVVCFRMGARFAVDTFLGGGELLVSRPGK